jgi:hypothetical protein
VAGHGADQRPRCGPRTHAAAPTVRFGPRRIPCGGACGRVELATGRAIAVRVTAPLVCERLPVTLLVLVAAMVPWPGESVGDWWGQHRRRVLLPLRPGGPVPPRSDSRVGRSVSRPRPRAVRHSSRAAVAARRLAGRADPVPPAPGTTASFLPSAASGRHRALGDRPRRDGRRSSASAEPTRRTRRLAGDRTHARSVD